MEHILQFSFTFTGAIQNIIQVQSTLLMGTDIQWRYSIGIHYGQHASPFYRLFCLALSYQFM